MYHAGETVCVLGLGYIGLPTASLLATKGFKVFGCDTNPTVVETVNCGDVHIVEQGLDIVVRSAVESGQLKAYLEPQPADIYIISVPTPVLDNHKPDIRYVESATRAIAPFVKAGSLIILESTSPVGTMEKISKWLAELRSDLVISTRDQPVEADISNQVYLAHCPERVLPGHIFLELVENDRIIGGVDKISAEKAKAFYQTFVQGNLWVTDSRTAEMTKLTENAFRDVNIAFANELSIICKKIDINVWELIRLANHHPRVDILKPGPGVGGHCIAVDPWFIVDSAPESSFLIRTAREVNDRMPDHIVERVVAQAARFKNPTIACLGLAFKANIDDLRESPSLKVVAALANKGIARLLIVEPHIDDLPAELNMQPEVELVEFQLALLKADIILLLVDHTQFSLVDKNLLDQKIIIDTRGVWEKIDLA